MNARPGISYPLEPGLLPAAHRTPRCASLRGARDSHRHERAIGGSQTVRRCRRLRPGPAVRDRLRGVVLAALRPCRGGLVLLHHAGWDAAALADRDAVVFRPRADVAAVLTA